MTNCLCVSSASHPVLRLIRAAAHKVDIPYLPVDTARELRTHLAAEAARTAFRW